MKWLKILKFVLIFLLFVYKQSHAKDLRPWVYFDLGDTIINSKDMKHLKYFKGAKQYLATLKDRGYKIGLITNIPETFGNDYEEKLETLKKLIHDGWDDSEEFDWEVFNLVILPLKNIEMKPAPILFQKALNHANGCPALYLSENSKEIVAAKSNGFVAKLFFETDGELYIPVDKMASVLKMEFQKEYNEKCFDHII